MSCYDHNSGAEHSFPQIHRHGLNGVLVNFGSTLTRKNNAQALAFYERLRATQSDLMIECAPTLVSVFVEFREDADYKDIYTLLSSLLADLEEDITTPQKRLWTIPTCFAKDHAPQLTEVASILGISEEETVKSLCAERLTVLAIGFAPGQPYLGLLPDAWNFSRMSALNPQIPRGAIAASLRQIVLFQNKSATGWRHIGQTKFQCFETNREEAFLLQAGDLVQFSPISKLEFDALEQNNAANGGAKMDTLT